MFGAPLLAAEAEATGIAALGVDLTSLLIYVLNFGILLLILYFVGYKRILSMMDQRSSRIRESLEEAERVRQEAHEREAQMQETLDAGRLEGQRALLESRELAENYRREEAAKARHEAERLLDHARTEIQQERDAAVDQVRKEFASLAVDAAERIIHRSVDAKTHQDLIDEVLSEADNLPESGLRR